MLFSFMYCWILVVLSSYTFLVTNLVKCDLIFDTNALYEVCPYNNFCRSNATYTVKDKNQVSCCGPCYCDQDCWRRGNCCPDSDLAKTKTPEETCESVIVKPRTDVRKINTVMRGYYIIKKCPKTEKNDTVVKKCTGELAESIEDFIWVTDTENLRIYNNKFCAGCHGVLNYIEWNIATDDIARLLDASNFGAGTSLVKNSCGLTVFPPEEKHMKNDKSCVIPDITECNVTGRWTIYNKVVAEACRSFIQYFVKDSGIANLVYRNVFCYICNGGIVNPTDTCKKENNGKAWDKSVAALLDWRLILSVKSRASQRGICDINEVEVTGLKKKCRPLSCPALQVPVFGECKRLTIQTRYLGLAVEFLLYPLWNKTKIAINDPLTYDFNKLGEAIRTTFKQDLKHLERRCGECGQGLGIYFGRSTVNSPSKDTNLRNVPFVLLFKSRFYTKADCHESLIVDRISKLLGKEMIVELDSGDHMTFHVSLNTDMFVNRKVIFSLYHYCPVRRFCDYIKLVRCPSIVLDTRDYFTLMDRASSVSEKRLINTLFGISNMGNNTDLDFGFSATVCLEDYEAFVFSSASFMTSVSYYWLYLSLTFIHE